MSEKKDVLVALRMSLELFDLIKKVLKHRDFEEYGVSSLIRKFVTEGLRRLGYEGKL